MYDAVATAQRLTHWRCTSNVSKSNVQVQIDLVHTALRALTKFVFFRSTILGSRLINLAVKMHVSLKDNGVYNAWPTFSQDLIHVWHMCGNRLCDP